MVKHAIKFLKRAKAFASASVQKTRLDISKNILWPLFSLNGFSASVYYLIFSERFRREHRAVLKGKLVYYKTVKAGSGAEFMLRRNTHRLEKGILSRPLKSVFAERYILETVNTYKALRASPESNNSSLNETLKWSHDVLKNYFQIVNHDPKIQKAHKIFVDTTPPINHSKTLFVPYARNVNSRPVEYENFFNLAQKRRSVRWFEDKPVPEELIEKALIVASAAPSACNRQPFEYRIFTEKEKIKYIASIPMGTVGFYHNFPAIAVIVGKLDAYPHERDRHVIYIDGGLSAMSFMFALETLGLSSCPINWPDINLLEKKMARILNLQPDQRPVMLIAFGYPDPKGLVAYSQKKPINQIAKIR